MAAPPGKTLIRLADGRTIAVASEDAARYEYFSQDGKIMRRPRAQPPAGASRPAPPPPAARPAPAAPTYAAPPPVARPPAPPVAPARPAPPPPAPVHAPPPPPPPRPAPPPPAHRAPPPARRRPVPIPLPVLGYNTRVIIATLALVLLIFSPVTYPVFESYGPLVDQLTHLNSGTFNQRTFPRTAEFDLTREISLAAAVPLRYNLTLNEADTIPGKQDILSFTQSPLPTGTNGRLFWNRTMTAGSTETVQTVYHVKMTTYQWLLDEEDVATAADVPSSYARYLDAEWRIDPTLASVQALANSITNRSANYLDQIDALYTWLLTHYTYQKSPSFEPKTPDETMAANGGDCDDQSVLFISMARYLGIPAWLELGLLYDEFRQEWGAHGWATVYIPLKNGTGVEATIDVVNRLFLIRDPYHFSDWSADGDAANLEKYYVLLTYTQQANPPQGIPALTVTERITNGPMTNTGVVNYFHG